MSESPRAASLKLPFPGTIFTSPKRIWLPLISGLVVVALSTVFSNLPMSTTSVAPQATVPSVPMDSAYYKAILAERANPTSPDTFLHPFAWMSSALLVSVLFAVSLTVSIYTYFRESRNKPVAVTLIVLSFLSGVASIAFYGHQTLIEVPMRSMLLIESSVPKPPFTMVMDWLLWWNSMQLVPTLCALCSIFPPKEDKLETLIRRKRLATALMYISAFTLTIAVVQVNLLYRLPGSQAALGVTPDQFLSIAAGITMITGASFTALLVAIFLPVLIVLRTEALRIAVSEGYVTSPDQLEPWLKEQGFDGSWQHQISRIVALIGPFIAGWLGEPVVQALSSL